MITGSEMELAEEVAHLRARVADLEDQLLAAERWGNETVASAQEQLYWLERWHVDVNALMRRRSAERLRATVRAARTVYRLALRVKRAVRPAR